MKISGFTGKYRFFSNSYFAPTWYCGIKFPTAEHAYQWAKCKNDVDKKKILECRLPSEAKKAGKKVEIRDSWDLEKIDIMYDIVWSKFFYNDELKKKLLDTNDAEIVEENWCNDTFWGVCRGEGENHLGKILMEIRNHIRGIV